MSKRSRKSKEEESAVVKSAKEEHEQEQEEQELDEDDLELLDLSSDEEEEADSFAAGPFLLGSQAPDFAARAVVNGAITEDFSLSEHFGKTIVLFFYPLNWTYVCPTELVALSDRHKEFEALGAQVIGISVDSAESHLRWSHASRKDGGLGAPLAFPLVSDLSGAIAETFGCRWLAGHSCRATYIVDSTFTVRHLSLNHDPVGRNVDEILRIISALKHAEEHPGEACPIGWTKGKPTIKADPVGAKEYFSNQK